MSVQRLFMVAFAVCVAYLSAGCGDIHPGPSVRVQPSVEVVPSTMSTAERHKMLREVAAMRARNELRLAQVRESFLKATILWNETATANAKAEAERKYAETVRAARRVDSPRPASQGEVPSGQRGTVSAPPVVAVSADIASVMAGDCQALLARYFGDDLAWAQRVVQRESGCTAGAINQREGCDTSGRTNSHAMGVFQMCYPMHEPTFAAVGCAGQPLDLECNIKAARALYNGSGRGPWGG